MKRFSFPWGDLHDPSAIPTNIPEWIANLIKESREYDKLVRAMKKNEGESAGSPSEGEPGGDDGSDVPF